MAAEKNSLSGNTDMLLLKLLAHDDMYGYQIIEELARRSHDVFAMKAGTLYPLLHQMEGKGLLKSYESTASSGKQRKYYQITDEGREYLVVREKEWKRYANAVNSILIGGC